jgi:HK97 family phage prohead protease
MTTTKALFGYATLYGVTTREPHHGVLKQILPGTFSKTLNRGAPVDFLLNHQDIYRLGSTRDILELYDHEGVGLAMRARLPDTELGRHVRQMTERGDNGASIGFDWHGAKKITRVIDGRQVECVVDATLDEISFCSGMGSGVRIRRRPPD